MSFKRAVDTWLSLTRPRPDDIGWVQLLPLTPVVKGGLAGLSGVGRLGVEPRAARSDFGPPLGGETQSENNGES
jgi:hypothetical protein